MTMYRPGDGQNLTHYKSENIIKLYLVEPCAGLHKRLQENVKKAGLEDVTMIIGQSLLYLFYPFKLPECDIQTVGFKMSIFFMTMA